MKRLLLLLLILAAPALGQQRNPLTRGLADTLYVKLAGSDTVLGTVTFTNLVVTGTCTGCGSGSGTGDFVGPGAATDNAVVRFDGTTGKLGQNSVVTIGDAGEVAGAKYVDLNGGSGLFRISTSATGFSIFDFADSGQSVSLSLAGLTSSHTITVPDADGTFAFTTSTVAKATALAANGTNCSASNAPLGVDASGNSEGCFAVLVPSGALGTPSSGTLTNATGLPISTGVSGLASGIATFLGAATSANLAAAVSDETGSGLLVFGTSPVIVTPTIASFVNATHNHQNAAGGGSLDAAAIGSGTFVAGRMPALTNDVTTSAGSVATSVVQLHLNVTALTSASSPYTVAATDSYIGADATSGTITINLPAATGSRRLIIVKKVDAVNNVTITPNGTDTIDGSNASMVANTQNANHGFIDAAAGVWYTSHRIAIGGALSGSSNNVTVNVLNTTATTAGTARSDTATAPAQTASAQAGVGYSITASPAVAGSTNAGAAAGGSVTITAGAAAQKTSGNANGGNLVAIGGAGVGTGTKGILDATGVLNVVGPNGTAGAPAFTFAGSLTTGPVWGNTGGAGMIETSIGGTFIHGIDNSGAVVASNKCYGFSSQSADLSSTRDLLLCRGNAAATLQVGGANAASPAAQIVQSQGSRSGTDTNTKGADMTIQGGPGTGTGGSGDIYLAAAPSNGSSGTGADTYVNVMRIRAVGLHVEYTGTSPALSSCGSSPSIVGNDNVMRITIGTGAQTTCTATFSKAWTNAPICTTADASNVLAVEAASTTTVLTLTSLTSMGGDSVNVQCFGFF